MLPLKSEVFGEDHSWIFKQDNALISKARYKNLEGAETTVVYEQPLP